jgi:hypothetical protein
MGLVDDRKKKFARQSSGCVYARQRSHARDEPFTMPDGILALYNKLKAFLLLPFLSNGSM